MTDKEQIKELEKIIDRTYHPSVLAADVYNAGYRKVSEGDIIITEDENFENLKHIATCVRKLKTKIRKETAKEILQGMLNNIHKLTGCGVPYHVKKFIEDFAKEYGVEVEE